MIVFHGHGIDDIIDEAAVKLVVMIKAPAAEARQPAPEHPEPDLAGDRVDIHRGDHPPGQAVLLGPGLDLFGLLVIARQAALGADPDAVLGRFDGKDMVVGQAILGGELFPVGIDIRQAGLGFGCGGGRIGCWAWEQPARPQGAEPPDGRELWQTPIAGGSKVIHIRMDLTGGAFLPGLLTRSLVARGL